MVSIFLKIHSLTSKRHEVFITLKGLTEHMKTEDTCEEAELFQDLEDKDIMYIIGKWRKLGNFNQFRHKRFFNILLGLESLLQEPFEIRHTIQHKSTISERCREV